MRRRLLVAGVAALAAASIQVVPAVAGGFCSGHGGEALTDRRSTTVIMEGNCFTPTVVRVEAGDSVTFTNEDPETHTVGGVAGSFGDMHAEVVPGAAVTHKFATNGIYPYVCLLHPGLAGAVVVGDGIAAAAGSDDVRAGATASRPRADSIRADGARPGAGAAPLRALALGGLVALAGLGVHFGRARRSRAPEGA
jgi:plastocyanin